MDVKKAKNRIAKLRQEISRLRVEYHVLNNPAVTDDVYDSLTRELKNLEAEYPELADQNSAINRVAGKPLDAFKKVTHASRMLSLNDAFSKEEVIAWEHRIKKLLGSDISHVDYFCELKLDGLAVSLIYEDGIFVRGATRGDGFVGEDITENLKMIKRVPLVLTPSAFGHSPLAGGEKIEVRGEVVMPKSSWEKLNKIQASLGKTLFANTRNAAAGSLRQLDPAIVAERNLDFFAWDLLTSEHIDTHSKKHEYLRLLGFQAVPYEQKAEDLERVFSFIDLIDKKRATLPYGIDGVVVSVDRLDLQDKIGVVGKAPRYMVAYKYQAERATTTVTDITVNVGRTGVLTPLAHFVPTLVAGSTVSKATLHNMDQIHRLDIRIGDTVVIHKAGDVIPEVVEVLTALRTGTETTFTMPKKCPVCGARVEQKESNNKSVAYYCTNKVCPAKNSRSMQHFVNIFEIYTIGPKILDRLKDEGLISDAADLFTLEVSDLAGLERFGEKSAENIISSINAHRKISLWRFIYALGIVHVGEQTARDIADHCKTLSAISRASIEEIHSIPNIGPVVSKSVHDFFAEKNNQMFIEKLLANGVIIEKVKAIPAGEGTFAGQTFVLTGTLETLSRDEAKQKITAQGGKVSSSVSAKTSYVVAGSEPGSKYTDAQKLGVKILNEEEFLKIL